MQKSRELKEKLIQYKKICEKKLKELEDTISKKRYYKRIGSFIMPHENINKLLEYYNKKEKKYKLPDCIYDIAILNKIISIVMNDRNVVSLMYIEDRIDLLEFLDPKEKNECIQCIIKIFGLRNILLGSNKLDSTAKEIYFNLKDTLVSILNKHMKERILILKTYIEEEIKDVDIDNLLETKEELHRKIYRLIRYISSINNDEVNLSFNTLEECDEFFECLKEIKFPSNDIDELREDIIKTFKNKKKKITEEEIKKEFDAEEIKVYNDIIELIDNVENDTYLIDSPSSVSHLKDNFSLEYRIKVYGKGSGLDLVKIIHDIKENLLPNIIIHKDEIISIFKYILNLYSEYLYNKTQKDELEEVLFQLRKILKKNRHVLDYYDNLSEFNKSFFDKILNEIKRGRYDTFKMMEDYFSKKIDFYELFNILREIEFNVEIFNSVINKDIIPQDEFDDLLEMAGEIIEKYDELEYEERFDKKIEYAQDHEFKGKSLIGFMNIDYQNFDNEQKKILQRAIIKLFEQSWVDYSLNAHENELKPISYRKSNGKIVKLKASGFDVSRIRINKYRIGIITINVCKENNEKLSKKYGLTGPFIILLEPFPILGADHNKYYEYIVDVINENKEEIDRIVSLFSNPDAKEEDLFKIIEDGILSTKEILKKKIINNTNGQELS